MDRLIEYKTKQNKDISQILFLENELLSKDSILVIEDSFPIRSVLQKYLLSLGFSDIYTADNGKEGIEIFKDLSDGGRVVPVLLDDSLPDYSAREIAPRLFQIYRTAKILVLSTKKIDHPDSINLIDQGIYGLIQKPVSFEDVKNTLEKLKKDADDNTFFDIKEELQKTLRFHKIISKAKLSEFIDVDEEFLSSTVNELQSSGLIQKGQEVQEMSCNKCSSVRIMPRFFCPTCNGTFTRSTLIEHHECGNVSEASSYNENICPKCHKQLKIMGVDYRVLENYYVCNSCKDKFPNPNQIFECQRCGYRQKIYEGGWKISDLYHIRH